MSTEIKIKCSNTCRCYFEVNQDRYTSLTTVWYESSQLRSCRSQLKYPLSDLTMVTLRNDQHIVMIGGYDWKLQSCSDKISVWDTSNDSLLSDIYPAIPTKRCKAVATVFKQYIVVAGGWKTNDDYVTNVEILNTDNKRWNSAPQLPFLEPGMKHATYEEKWYLAGEKLYTVSLSELVKGDSEIVWNTLPDPPLKYPGIIIINGNLLAIGGQHIDGTAAKKYIGIKHILKIGFICVIYQSMQPGLTAIFLIVIAF